MDTVYDFVYCHINRNEIRCTDAVAGWRETPLFIYAVEHFSGMDSLGLGRRSGHGQSVEKKSTEVFSLSGGGLGLAVFLSQCRLFDYGYAASFSSLSHCIWYGEILGGQSVLG
ncbi:hypothetical protein D3C77_532770 [compost metagenome]